MTFGQLLIHNLHRHSVHCSTSHRAPVTSARHAWGGIATIAGEGSYAVGDCQSRVVHLWPCLADARAAQARIGVDCEGEHPVIDMDAAEIVHCR